MEGDLATARTIAASLVGERSFLGAFARALVAYRDGEIDRARQFLQEAQSAAPQLIAEPRRALERAGFCPSITARFVADLHHAGLASAMPDGPATSAK
jgi:hypothetical protein